MEPPEGFELREDGWYVAIDGQQHKCKYGECVNGFHTCYIDDNEVKLTDIVIDGDTVTGKPCPLLIECYFMMNTQFGFRRY